MKKVICIFLSFLTLGGLFSVPIRAQEDIAPFDVKAKSAVLMDATTGTILYAKNADEALPPASVTKVMTLLLVCEQIDAGNMALTDMISVSEHAASMGGSQVYLEPNEQMSVDDLLKCVVIASANDAAMTLAEAVCGSEEAFVQRMNERAKELGMEHTSFENPTGLDDEVVNHTISALDIALCSRELITKHPLVLQYSSIWMDTIRDGAFGLSNTNRLIRFYSGATGLKTGSTAKAGFCISATACRDNLHLIAVIMGSATRDERNEAAKQLLDWGFANYSLYTDEGTSAGEIKVLGGVKNNAAIEYGSFTKLLAKGLDKKVTIELIPNETAAAPVKKGDKVGFVRYVCEGETIGETNLIASENVDKINFLGIFVRMLKLYFLN